MIQKNVVNDIHTIMEVKSNCFVLIFLCLYFASEYNITLEQLATIGLDQ